MVITGNTQTASSREQGRYKISNACLYPNHRFSCGWRYACRSDNHCTGNDWHMANRISDAARRREPGWVCNSSLWFDFSISQAFSLCLALQLQWVLEAALVTAYRSSL